MDTNEVKTDVTETVAEENGQSGHAPSGDRPQYAPRTQYAGKPGGPRGRFGPKRKKVCRFCI
ncbi:MAG: hypothetical protein LBN42_01525, partial [Oscillospiraceae bacterium]|nr:hypothetical protein [Oscillospiraceae bacterium]